MNIRKTLYLLSTILGLIAIAGGISVFISCHPADEAVRGTAPANTCPAVVEQKGDDFNMVVSSDTKQEKPLIDVNAPVDVETATFALG